MKSKALKIVGGIIVVLVALAIIAEVSLSPKSHIERSIVVNASPAAIFPLINSLKNMNKWSPWLGKDPKSKVTFEGPDAGVGAKMKWESQQLGNGAQWILESNPDQHMKSAMDFSMEGTYTSDIFLTPVDQGTKVTWSYDGDVTNTGIGTSLMGRVMGKFMDNMLGPDYEKGLAQLKNLAESQTPATPNTEQKN